MQWTTELLGRAKPPGESCHETRRVGRRGRSWRCRRGVAEVPRQAADETCAADAVPLRERVEFGHAEGTEADCDTLQAGPKKAPKPKRANGPNA